MLMTGGNGWWQHHRCWLLIVVDGVRITVFGVIVMMVIGSSGCSDDDNRFLW